LTSRCVSSLSLSLTPDLSLQLYARQYVRSRD